MPNVFQTIKNTSFSTKKKNLREKEKYREENLTRNKEKFGSSISRVLKSCFAKRTSDVPRRCPKNKKAHCLRTLSKFGKERESGARLLFKNFSV